MGKILHFSVCRGEEYFTAPHNTSRRGGFSFTPVPFRPQAGQNSPCSAPLAPKREKILPARSKHPKISAFSLAGRIFLGLTQNPLLLGEFFTLMGATATSQHPPTASPETDDTNAGGSLPQNETTDTFARTKQPNSGHFPPAKVSRVSSTPRRAPAKALPVSSDVKSGLMVRSKVLRHSCLPPFCWPW